MEHCLNCGANVKFDIKSQQLYCEYCGSYAEPKAIQSKEAAEDSFFETTMYRCPNCNGDIVAEDNEAAVFCPYCGDTVVLEGKLIKLEKPKYILPFKKTKEDCVNAYKKLLRRSIYAPHKLLTKGVTDSFRGIYMPYWSYKEKLHGTVTLQGERRVGELEQEAIYHYDMNYKMDVEYDSITFDAAKVFPDDLSLAIAPYDMTEQKEFAPGYISGFYADTFDVDASTYRDCAHAIAREDVVSRIRKTKNYKKYHMKEANAEPTLKRYLEPITKESNIGYHPVWFMRYRFGDRMSYATINGQTGKAAGLIPASPVKYLLFSLLTMIPLFFAVNMVSLLRPQLLLMFTDLLALFVYLIYDKECMKLKYREETEGVLKYDEAKYQKIKLSKKYTRCKKLFIIGLLAGIAAYLYSLFVDNNLGSQIFIHVYTTVIIVFFTFDEILSQRSNIAYMKRRFLYVGIPIFSAISLATVITNPVSDSSFYVVGLLQMMSTALVFIDLIYYHNIISTKPMPQFNRTGGDDNAE